MRIALIPLFALALAAPALAQDSNVPEPKINQLIIYGNDKCPESTDDNVINVCAKKPEEERFRIPKDLRASSAPSNDAWNNKVLAYETVGRTGTLSCSPVGPGGWTGCANKLINEAYAEKRHSDEVKMGELVAAARAKRLETVDKDAAETQARVEQAEKEIEAREKARAEAEAEAKAKPQDSPAAPTKP